MATGDTTSKELKKKKIHSSWSRNSKVSKLTYLKLMLSKSSSDTSAKLIVCLVLGLYLSGVILAGQDFAGQFLICLGSQ